MNETPLALMSASAPSRTTRRSRRPRRRGRPPARAGEQIRTQATGLALSRASRPVCPPLLAHGRRDARRASSAISGLRDSWRAP